MNQETIALVLPNVAVVTSPLGGASLSEPSGILRYGHRMLEEWQQHIEMSATHDEARYAATLLIGLTLVSSVPAPVGERSLGDTLTYLAGIAAGARDRLDPALLDDDEEEAP